MAAALALIVGLAGAADANAHDRKSYKHKHGHKVEKLNGHTYYRRGPYNTVFYRGNDRYIVRGSPTYYHRNRVPQRRVHYQRYPTYRYPSNGLSFVFKFD